MQTATVNISTLDAHTLWKKYQTHRLNQGAVTPVDREIERLAKLIASGRKVIRAMESIRAAGVNEQGLPKLAIMRADQKACQLYVRYNGQATMYPEGQALRGNMAREFRFELPEGFCTVKGNRRDFKALLPHIPPHIRPVRGLANYHILWEAEWERVVPIDPMLLRRIGNDDLWLVCAAWDLTEVERAVLAGRL